MSKGYWAYARYGELTELYGEYDTKQEAIDAANEDYMEDILDDQVPRNGELFENIYSVVYVEDIDVEYEHYHGDYAEHFHQGDYI